MTRSEIGLIKNQYIGEYHIAIVMGIGIWEKKHIEKCDSTRVYMS